MYFLIFVWMLFAAAAQPLCRPICAITISRCTFVRSRWSTLNEQQQTIATSSVGLLAFPAAAAVCTLVEWTLMPVLFAQLTALALLTAPITRERTMDLISCVPSLHRAALMYVALLEREQKQKFESRLVVAEQHPLASEHVHSDFDDVEQIVS